MFRAHRWLLVLAFASVVFASPSIASTNSDNQNVAPATIRLPGHVLPALAKATIVPEGTKNNSDPITVTLVLKHDDQPGFDRFLHDLYDPKSPSFHRFLTQRQIADRFGPSRADYNSVLHWMRSHGFSLERGSRNRLTLTMRGTRAQAERAFQVSIADYQFGKSRFFANDQDPAVPAQMASSVQSVIGLSNLAELGLKHGHMNMGIDALHGCVTSNSNADVNSPAGAIGVACGVAYVFAAIIYDLGCMDRQVVTGTYEMCAGVPIIPLDKGHVSGASTKPSRDANLSVPTVSSLPGAGQTVGLVEFDSYDQSDVSDFLALVDAPAQISQLNEVKVGGGAPIGSGESEVLLDIDTVMMLAPGANVSVYSAPFTGAGTSFQTVLNQMVDDKVNVISNSWAYCEDQTTQADVNSIDTIFQNAAGAGISAFNGAGDSGSTCLDGSANTVAVPADSPHATAVGGSSVVVGSDGQYDGESWWNGSNATPQTGQGGFGVSKFFTTPSYQTGLSAMRSVPDVVANADPAANGVVICQADNGGCPTNLLYGGTSIATPIWAAFTADMNQVQGTDLGQINPLIYPLAGTDAFHTAASMGSDFAHVGLGSPNMSALNLALQSGAAVGTPSGSMSQASTSSIDIANDGSSNGYVAVQLRDANGNAVTTSKTVTLTANPGSHAMITPSSGTTTVANGAAVFSVTDLDAENVTFTATDTSDGVDLSTTPMISFVAAPSAQAAIGAFPTTVTADGATTSTITVTLEDSLSRPSPGKEIQLTQTGNSIITGPNPPVTNSSGVIQFTVTDTNNETVSYNATDVTDGNLPFPETTEVTFSSGPEPGCANGTPVAASGYVVTPYVTGLLAKDFSYADGEINFGGCPGAGGIAFDTSGNIFVSDLPTGDIYKLPSGGGAADAGSLLNGTLGVAVGQLVYEDGKLYAVQGATTGGSNTGAITQLNPTTGAVVGTVASGLNCPEDMAADPLTGDLFVDDACEGPAGNNALVRISNPGGESPTVSTYATLPNQGNYQITFAPDGTIYVITGLDFSADYAGTVVEVGGTNTTQPAAVTTLSSINAADLFLLAAGTASGGGAQYLISGSLANNPNSSALGTFDLTTSPPSAGAFLANSSVGIQASIAVFGPDGCVYLADGNAVFRVTDTAGDCTYAANLAKPSLVLTPPTVSPNPAQGSAQTLTANLHYATLPAGTPVLFSVTGADTEIGSANTNASGQASFTYTGAHQGVDTIKAIATVSGSPVTSNESVIAWGPGPDVTFLSLNLSPKGALEGEDVNLVASLTDVSQNPIVALSGQTINFSAGSEHCSAATNAQGIATCQIAASGSGIETLSASFAGTGSLVASNASDIFNVTTPAPVAGKLKVSPKALNFGSVEIGSDKIKTVKVTNAGKITKKKSALPILIEMESGVPSPFTLTQECNDDELGPKSKGVAAGSCTIAVEFTPAAAMKYSGTMTILDNLEPNLQQSVKLEGTGKAPKK